ncbi:ABC-type proline/glycine betaine transport system, permease component [Bellilinea caldifistulae]|uniref:ABC transporter permease n=1 Tax=Bellilinea caldifistulae TaxID=360411 RepID=UPI000A58BC9A|nr:ABC transporter permease [Bellilinea caldifistulae]GAP10970.1 ABC-type proline/glycine betaine transport system, permease component [Bellilinea caldifistulae]
MVDTLIHTLWQSYLYFLNRQTEFWGAVVDHLILAGIAIGLAILVCVPLGIWTSKSRFASLTLMNLVNGLRVIPSLAVLFLIIPYLGLTSTSAIVALTILAMPPVLINTDAAFRTLEPAIIEAARGMGMSAFQRLIKVEFPLAIPVILTGVRISAVDVIASATLAAFVGSGGLGIYITRGFALYDYSILFVGAIPVALITLAVEGLLALLQKTLQPIKT